MICSPRLTHRPSPLPQLFCILGMICVASTYNPYSSPASFYYFAASVGLVVALILFIIYVTHLRDKIAPTLRLNFVVSTDYRM